MKIQVQKVFILILAAFVVFSVAPVVSAEPYVSIDPDSPFRNGAFHGIWIGAARTLSEAVDLAYNAPSDIGVIQIYLSSDWSELNTQPWYVLTAGIYGARYEAEMMLPQIQTWYPDAYIKYSGIRLSSFTGGSSGIGLSGFENSGSLTPSSFYGIWCEAFKSYQSAAEYVTELQNAGLRSAVAVLTTDWSGLNSEPWYAVSAGKYDSEASAYGALPSVQEYCNDAYVKYSGIYQGSKTTGGSEFGGSQQFGSPEEAFYGIWCEASKDYSEMKAYADNMCSAGYPYADVILTTDWANLNPEPWFVVTAGRYVSESAAYNVLSDVRKYCGDAYVKFSGAYQGP